MYQPTTIYVNPQVSRTDYMILQHLFATASMVGTEVRLVDWPANLLESLIPMQYKKRHSKSLEWGMK